MTELFKRVHIILSPDDSMWSYGDSDLKWSISINKYGDNIGVGMTGHIKLDVLRAVLADFEAAKGVEDGSENEN
jgi:hypothetical protein